MYYRRMPRGLAYLLFPMLIAPFVYLFQLVIFLVKALTFLIPIILISLVVLFIGLIIIQKVNNVRMNKQLKANIKRNKELGPVVANRNDYTALKLDSVSVAPLDETDIHAFRNTPAYKKMQAANKMNPIKQYASY